MMAEREKFEPSPAVRAAWRWVGVIVAACVAALALSFTAVWVGEIVGLR